MNTPNRTLNWLPGALLLLLPAAVLAQDFNVATGDWDVAGNWNPANVPLIGGNVTVGSGRAATIQSSGSINADTLWVGVTSGAGTVTQNGNTFNINTRLSVGNDARNGTYNLTNGTINGVGKELILSRANTAGNASGTFTQSGGVANFATINMGLDGAAGRVRSGFLNINGGTFNNTGDINIANSAAALGNVTVAGGTFNSTGGNTHVGNATTGAIGTFTVSSGTFNKSAGEFRIANAGTSTGILNVNGGTFTAGRVDVANGAASVGTVNVSNGSFTRSNGQWATGAGSTVTVNHTGGTMTNTSWTDFVPNASSNGTWNQSGGTSTFGDNFHVGLRGSATLNVSGGVMTKTGGGEFDIAEGRDTTLTTRGVLNLSGTGVINVNAGNWSLGRTAGTGTVNISGGTFNKASGGANNIGGGANTYGYLNLSGGQLSTNGDTRIGNNGNGIVTQTGGRWDAAGSWFTTADAATGASGIYNISGGVLNHTGTSGMHLGVRGNGTFNVSGTGTVQGGALYVGRGEGGTSPTGRWNQTGGVARFDTLNVGLNTATGIFNLEGGTFRVSTIANTVGGGSQINWGAGALAPRNVDGGNPTGADLSTGTGFTQVRNSTTPFTSNANLTTGNGVNAPSRLDLGGLYLSGASVLFDHFVVGAGRTLNLASTADILEFNDDTAYLLRPFGFSTEDYGSLPLVTTGAGASIVGTFDTFIGLNTDSRGWSQFTGIFTTASALDANTWYLEQTGSAITFHYKVAGTVPEPGTLGLASLGIYLLRLARRRTAAAAA